MDRFSFSADCQTCWGGHPQFSMSLVDIAMEPQSLDVGIGGFHVANLFAGEIGWESALPELVFAFDLPSGLG
jgi:hypothetical protein